MYFPMRSPRAMPAVSRPRTSGVDTDASSVSSCFTTRDHISVERVSKAFTREEDDAAPLAPVKRRRVPLPDGVPNYVTAAGARALRAEMAAGGDEVRMQELAEHLGCAEIIEPEPDDQVRFGSTVVTSTGARYRIVGAIEADPKQHAVSWQSPIARALLGARVGDEVVLPGGDEVTIATIS